MPISPTTTASPTSSPSANSSHSSGYSTEKSELLAEKSNEELIEEAIGSPKKREGPVLAQTQSDSKVSFATDEPVAPAVSYSNTLTSYEMQVTSPTQFDQSETSQNSAGSSTGDQLGSPLNQSSPAKVEPTGEADEIKREENDQPLPLSVSIQSLTSI